MHEDEVTTLGKIIEQSRRIAIQEARRRGQSHADAEDTAQAVSYRFWMAVKAQKTITSVEAWTRRTTANYIIDAHRRESRIKNGSGLLESLTGLEEFRIART